MFKELFSENTRKLVIRIKRYSPITFEHFLYFYDKYFFNDSSIKKFKLFFINFIMMTILNVIKSYFYFHFIRRFVL
ncbi:Protein of unknown function [Gryllus bimaculatus]|nr:Protein of unknown function [Gryllus bimaculatus]